MFELHLKSGKEDHENEKNSRDRTDHCGAGLQIAEAAEDFCLQYAFPIVMPALSSRKPQAPRTVGKPCIKGERPDMDKLSVHLSLGRRASERDYIQAERLCEFYGFQVVSTGRDRGETLRPEYMETCDVVIADLRKWEAGEPEPGVVFDLGIGYGKRKRLYGFVSDARDLIHRYPYAYFGGHRFPMDQYGLRFTTAWSVGNLMYSVPTKIVEGGMELCVKTVWYDRIEALKQRGQRIQPLTDHRFKKRWIPGKGHKAYLAGYECFYENEEALGEVMICLCRENGFDADFPTRRIEGLKELTLEEQMDATVGMGATFDKNQYKILLSDIIIANMNPYHGLQPDMGTVFELGMAAGLGHLCVAFFSVDKDVLTQGMPRSRGWLVERRRYEPREYERYLRELFGDTPCYVRGTFSDAVRFVNNKLIRKKEE